MKMVVSELNNYCKSDSKYKEWCFDLIKFKDEHVLSLNISDYEIIHFKIISQNSIVITYVESVRYGQWSFYEGEEELKEYEYRRKQIEECVMLANVF